MPTINAGTCCCDQCCNGSPPESVTVNLGTVSDGVCSDCEEFSGTWDLSRDTEDACSWSTVINDTCVTGTQYYVLKATWFDGLWTVSIFRMPSGPETVWTAEAPCDDNNISLTRTFFALDCTWPVNITLN